MTLTAREFKDKVEAKYGESIFRLSALRIRDGAGVLEKVFGSGKYRTVLEIGTYRGLTTAFIAQFVDKVITVDLSHGRMESEWDTFSRTELWREMGVADRIDLKLVPDNAAKAALLRSLTFDIAFIDGAKFDIAEDFENVKRCGTVLFHDFDDRGTPEKNHVYDFARTRPEGVERMDIFALWRAKS